MGRSVAEASIIIEYLQMNPPGPVRLIPEDPAAALEVRFMDRFFDLYVMDGMQIAVEAALGRVAMTREDGLALSTQRPELTYGWLDGHLGNRTWAAGNISSMADGAASM
jgi:glutathione S-transferase